MGKNKRAQIVDWTTWALGLGNCIKFLTTALVLMIEFSVVLDVTFSNTHHVNQTSVSVSLSGARTGGTANGWASTPWGMLNFL